MTEALFRRAKEVYLDALDRPEAERAAFVAAACGTDAALRIEVESLLVAGSAQRLAEVVRE
ncbi:MAG: hypothetical protein WCC53_12645, partial [Thermoanaerobaculia bacterium]